MGLLVSCCSLEVESLEILCEGGFCCLVWFSWGASCGCLVGLEFQIVLGSFFELGVCVCDQLQSFLAWESVCGLILCVGFLCLTEVPCLSVGFGASLDHRRVLQGKFG
ncbi:hypothetical protein M758_3G018100 [Ceratodon purpureus]|nr:hypothetical protein M758_3G018100 [Ceratodon purpureus]